MGPATVCGTSSRKVDDCLPGIKVLITLHLKSVEAVASSVLLGCHATETMELWCCFLISLLTHQLCSFSKWHMQTHLDELPIANFASLGDHLTHSAARCSLVRTI